MNNTIKPKIIICEDELLIALDIKRILEKNGFAVAATVATGPDLINCTGQLLPDLIITDVTIKGEMNGIEAAQIISRNMSVPVIILSGIINNKTFALVENNDLCSFLSKPFDESVLIKTVEECLSY